MEYDFITQNDTPVKAQRFLRKLQEAMDSLLCFSSFFSALFQRRLALGIGRGRVSLSLTSKFLLSSSEELPSLKN